MSNRAKGWLIAAEVSICFWIGLIAICISFLNH